MTGGTRRPVHTVYVPADMYHTDLSAEWAAVAAQAMAEHAPSPIDLAVATGLSADLAACRLHARLVWRSLERSFYQGWDLHPAQLVTRYAASYAFIREGLPRAATRLRDYARRTSGGVLDEPATAQALAGYVLRGVDCGAVDAAEVTALTALDRAELESLARRLG